MSSLASLYDIAFRALKLLDGTERDFTRSVSYLYYGNIIRELQSAYLQMTAMGRKHNRFELLNYENCDLVTEGNLSQLDIRWNSRRGELVGIFKRQQGDQFLTPTALEFRAFYHPPEAGMELLGSTEYRIFGSTIYILRNTTWPKWRFYYLRKPGTLNQGTVSAATANSITLPASPTYGSLDDYDDAYKSDYLRITAGTGVGQTVRVTAYDRSTRIATVEPLEGDGDAFETVPTSSSTYSFLPWFPEEHCDALAYLTASHMKKVDLHAAIMGDMAMKMEEFQRYVALDDKVSPIRIVNTGRVQSGLMGETSGMAWWTTIPQVGSTIP
jgi:hypothetical protein